MSEKPVGNLTDKELESELAHLATVLDGVLNTLHARYRAAALVRRARHELRRRRRLLARRAAHCPNGSGLGQLSGSRPHRPTGEPGWGLKP